MFVKLCVTFYEMAVSVTLKEGCLVIYSVSESDFVCRVFAYMCLRVSNTCDKYSFKFSFSNS